MSTTKGTTRRTTKTAASKKPAKATVSTIELKIGVENSPQVLVIDVTLSTDEILDAINEATTNGTAFSVADPKGRRIVVPGSKISYVEVGEPNTRRVGFGVL